MKRVVGLAISLMAVGMAGLVVGYAGARHYESERKSSEHDYTQHTMETIEHNWGCGEKRNTCYGVMGVSFLVAVTGQSLCAINSK